MFAGRIVFAKLLSQRVFIQPWRNSYLPGSYWQQTKNIWWWVHWTFSWEKQDFDLIRENGCWNVMFTVEEMWNHTSVFWGSEAFLIVSMGHSLWYHWGQKKLVTIILKWKHLPLTTWLSGGYSVVSLYTRCDYTGYLCTWHAQGTLPVQGRATLCLQETYLSRHKLCP